jgi:hypothetical protein
MVGGHQRGLRASTFESSRLRPLALGLGALALALGALFLLRAPERSARATHVRDARESLAAEPAIERAGDGLPIKPHDPSTPEPDGPMHPHPITAAHERIFRENNLVGALSLAVDLQDPLQIRELVAEYRAEYPEDDHRLQDGYEIIADCLERHDETTRARAQRFWETEIRSQTRRYVRRHCLQR